MIDPKAEGAIDATGLETRHVSSYYVERQGYKRFKRRRWPKLTLVCETATHLIAAAVVSRGPSQDSPQFPEALKQAAENLGLEQASKVFPHIHRVFGNLKAWIIGTHHGVSEKHMQAYLNEYAFRFNRRFAPWVAFNTALGLASDSEAPTYEELYRTGSRGGWEHPQ